MTPADAERMLTEWVTVTRDRDNRVRAAVTTGLSKYRLEDREPRTGVSRTDARAGQGHAVPVARARDSLARWR